MVGTRPMDKPPRLAFATASRTSWIPLSVARLLMSLLGLLQKKFQVGTALRCAQSQLGSEILDNTAGIRELVFGCKDFKLDEAAQAVHFIQAYLDRKYPSF